MKKTYLLFTLTHSDAHWILGSIYVLGISQPSFTRWSFTCFTIKYERQIGASYNLNLYKSSLEYGEFYIILIQIYIPIIL